MSDRMEVLDETDEFTIVRRYSAAGFCDTVEYKPGFEPVEPVTVAQLADQIAAAKTLAEAKAAAAEAVG